MVSVVSLSRRRLARSTKARALFIVHISIRVRHVCGYVDGVFNWHHKTVDRCVSFIYFPWLRSGEDICEVWLPTLGRGNVLPSTSSPYPCLPCSVTIFGTKSAKQTPVPLYLFRNLYRRLCVVLKRHPIFEPPYHPRSVTNHPNSHSALPPSTIPPFILKQVEKLFIPLLSDFSVPAFWIPLALYVSSHPINLRFWCQSTDSTRLVAHCCARSCAAQGSFACHKRRHHRTEARETHNFGLDRG